MHMKNGTDIKQEVNKLGACLQWPKTSSSITRCGSVKAHSVCKKAPEKHWFAKPSSVFIWGSIDFLYTSPCPCFSFDFCPFSPSLHHHFLCIILHTEVHHTFECYAQQTLLPAFLCTSPSSPAPSLLSCLLILILLCSSSHSFYVSWTCLSDLGLNWQEFHIQKSAALSYIFNLPPSLRKGIL